MVRDYVETSIQLVYFKPCFAGFYLYHFLVCSYLVSQVEHQGIYRTTEQKIEVNRHTHPEKNVIKYKLDQRVEAHNSSRSTTI